MLEKTLERPWTARRSNQSTLKEMNPEYSLEGLMLKLQYFGHLMQRTNSLEKTLWDAGIRKRHSFYFLHLFYPFVNILASYSNLFS